MTKIIMIVKTHKVRRSHMHTATNIHVVKHRSTAYLLPESQEDGSIAMLLPNDMTALFHGKNTNTITTLLQVSIHITISHNNYFTFSFHK